MRISYIGNFAVSYSTETHIAKAWENLGHEVQRIPEQNLEWLTLPETVTGDILLWTRTAGFDPPDRDRQRQALARITVPKVGVHLDRWWGLHRETTERGPRDADPSPFFTHLDLLYTADGGHDAEWESIGVHHEWMPPAILSDECEPGKPQGRFKYDVAFVGNLESYGHAEWAPYRRELWSHLNSWYRERFAVFPGKGRPAIRGRELANLYATVKVLVGDSCLAGGIGRYWSDRIPETTGRGGYLIHPRVEGLSTQHPDLTTYELGNWDELYSKIEEALENPEARRNNALQNRAHVIAEHTYEHRMTRLLDFL